MREHHTLPDAGPRASIQNPRWMRYAITLACALASMATMLVADTSPAYAGNWMEVSCENPGGSAAPSEGWTSFANAGGYGSNTSTGCSPGSPMFAILSTKADVSVGAAETLQYTPPAGSTLTGGTVDVSMFADGGGYNASGTAVIYTPAYSYDASDVVLQCAAGLAPCANGTNNYNGPVPIPGGRGGNLYLSAGCGGTAGYVCNAGGSEEAWSLMRLWWANLLLSNSSTPAASAISGTLLSPNARGEQELAFTASDPGGPGVYAVTAQVDGKALYSATPDSNSGRCIPVGNSGGALMFDSSQPCRQSESVDISLNTAQVADGTHTLKVTVDDAAQNSSVVDVTTITTKNAPEASSPPAIIAPTSQVLTGAALSTHPGVWSAPSGTGTISYGYQWEDCDSTGNNCAPIAGAQSASYTPAPSDVGHTLRVVVNASDSDGLTSATSAATSAVLAPQSSLGASPGSGASGGVAGFAAGVGAPNGTGASEHAQLRLGIRRTITRRFARRALRITGRLLDAQGNPIGGATLSVIQQIAGAPTKLIGHAKTAANGDFAAGVRAGPSRLIEITYQAFSSDTAYAAEAKINESVEAGIQLGVAPRHTSSHGEIVLAGRILGPIPAQGVVVELLVHYHGRWEPFRDPRTDSSGHFLVEYQFEGGTGRFPFRAEVLGGQAGFPFTHGDSRAVYVTTN